MTENQPNPKKAELSTLPQTVARRERRRRQRAQEKALVQFFKNEVAKSEQQ